MCVQNEEQKKVKGTKSTGAMELEIQTVDLRPGHPTWAKRGQWKIEIEKYRNNVEPACGLSQNFKQQTPENLRLPNKIVK